jgi:hydrogenase maturation protease
VTSTVLIGVGNPFRRDDGVGPAVAGRAVERLEAERGSDIEVRILDGEPGRLLEAWAGADVAIVVDAFRSGAVAGTVRRLEVTPGRSSRLPFRAGLASSHGAGLEAAVALGRAVDRLPRRLVVFGVEGSDFREGPGLSAPVAASVDPVVDRIVDEVAR